MNESKKWMRVGNTILNLDEVSGIYKDFGRGITVYLNNGKFISVNGGDFDELWTCLKEMQNK